MPLVRFTLLTAAGSLIWNTLLIGLGAMLGRNWEQVATVVGPISSAALVLLVATTAVGGVWLIRRGRRQPARA